MKVVRKKPCPYCEKKLQAKSKLQWRNNLARHLGNACPPYERRMLDIGLQFISDLFSHALKVAGQSPEQILKDQTEIAELEKLYSASPSTDPPADRSEPT